MRKAILTCLVVPLLSQASLSAAETRSVWVFTSETLPPLRNSELAEHVYVLDDIEKSLSSLSFAYPGSDAKARQQASTLISTRQGQAVIARIQHRAEAVALAWQSGITKLPAVMVDQHFVVYGEYDVKNAIARVEGYRHAH